MKNILFEYLQKLKLIRVKYKKINYDIFFEWTLKKKNDVYLEIKQ